MKKKHNFAKDWNLFFIFFKIGLFTFGGGYAMIPLFKEELFKKRRYLEEQELNDIIAISQTTPGVISVNIAGFAGYRRNGLSGGVFSILGLVIPSLVTMMLASFFIDIFKSVKVIQWAFYGMRAGVLFLILKAFLSLRVSVKWDILTVLIFAAVVLASFFTGIEVILLLLAASVTGIIYRFLFNYFKEERKKK